ncbi:MAG TPA: hypothetical protein QGF58_20970 [Myxococcota bacterium]|nr:hypothetical protein [Myxococcota bacterium]
MLLSLILPVLAGPCEDDAAGRACVEAALEHALSGESAAASELKSACDAGNDDACFHRGVYALVLGKDQDFEVSESGRDALAGKCKAGVGAACYHLAVLHDRGPIDWRDRSQASMYNRQACGAGDPRGCHAQAVAYAAGGSATGVTKAKALFSDACYEQDHAQSCVGLAELLTASEPQAAEEAMERACALGSRGACK